MQVIPCFYLLYLFVQFEWQPIRISKESEPASGMFIDTYRFGNYLLLCEPFNSRIDVINGKCQVA